MYKIEASDTPIIFHIGTILKKKKKHNKSFIKPDLTLCRLFLQNARLAFSPSTSSLNPTLLYAPTPPAPPTIRPTANQQQSI